MVGRPPNPISLQLSAGDPRKKGKHKLQERLLTEPRAQSGSTPCPDHLTGVARDAWEFLSEQIELMGLNKVPDAMMLEGVCTAYARARSADADIAARGSILDDGKVNPSCGLTERAWTQVHRFATEFGLSPVSRSRLTIEKKDSASQDLASMLNRVRPDRAQPVQ